MPLGRVLLWMVWLGGFFSNGIFAKNISPFYPSLNLGVIISKHKWRTKIADKILQRSRAFGLQFHPMKGVVVATQTTEELSTCVATNSMMQSNQSICSFS